MESKKKRIRNVHQNFAKHLHYKQLEILHEAIADAKRQNSVLKWMQYLAERSKVYAHLGEKEKAVQDILTRNDLKPFCPKNPIDDVYIEYVEKYILKLKLIKSTIKELSESDELDPNIAHVLLEHAEITAGLVVEKGRHYTRFVFHSATVTKAEADHNEVKYVTSSNQLTNEMFNLLRCELEELKSKVLALSRSLDVTKFEIKNLDETKADKTEIEEFALKIPEEISQNPNLNQYFIALYNKLHSAMQEAESISAGHLELADSTKVSIATGIARLIPIPYAKQVASGTKGFASVVIRNKTKKKTITLIKLNTDPAKRQNILKQAAVRIALEERYREIERMKTSPNQEVSAKRNSKSVLDTLKDVFVVNMDDEITRKIDLFILGYLDAKKIIWAVNKGLIGSSSNKIGDEVEDTVSQLVKIPNDYIYEKEKEYKKKSDLNCDVLCGF